MLNPWANIMQEKEEEERDSKETRLTLMEEVLLLGLKEGTNSSENLKPIFVATKPRAGQSLVFYRREVSGQTSSRAKVTAPHSNRPPRAGDKFVS